MKSMEEIVERYSGASLKKQLAHINAMHPPEYAAGFKKACIVSKRGVCSYFNR